MGTPRIDRIDQNLIINGNFDYWQRGVSFSTAGSYYTADRMYTARSTGTNAYSRSTDVPDSQSTYSLRIQNTSGTNPRLGQRIAAATALKYIGKEITVQIKIKVGDATATPINITVQFPTATDNYASSTIPIDVAVDAAPPQGVWKTYRYTFVVPSDAVRGMQINFIRPSVSNVTTDTYFSQFIAREGEYTEDMLFSYNSGNIDSELFTCMKYFEKSYPMSSVPGQANVIGASGGYFARATSNGIFVTKFISEKIKNPVMTIYNPVTGTQGQYILYPSTNLTPQSISSTTKAFDVVSGDSSTVGSLGWHWTADAEI